MRARIVTVAAHKGGVGKTTLARELATVLGGVLIDFDTHRGGATRLMGYDPARFRRAPLLDALERGPGGAPPAWYHTARRPWQPPLVPSHPDLAVSVFHDQDIADCVAEWAQAWGSQRDLPYVILDTPPGTNTFADAAIQVSDLVVVPFVLASLEMQALLGLVEELAEYPLLVVPNRVPTRPPRVFIERLERMSDAYPNMSIAPAISEYRWLARRLAPRPVTAEAHPGARLSPAADEFRAVASEVQAAIDRVLTSA